MKTTSGILIGFLFAVFTLGLQNWVGPTNIQLKDGRTAHCPDHLVSTPAAVSCFTNANRGKNIFTIPKSEIRKITIGS